jgi:hypothetical protein
MGEAADLAPDHGLLVMDDGPFLRGAGAASPRLLGFEVATRRDRRRRDGQAR